MALGFLVFILLSIAVGALALITVYNNLVVLKNQLARSWANIDVLLKQRFDEIPQLVQVIEQFAKHEQNVIQRLVEARTRYGSARNIDDKIKASQTFSAALSGFLAIGEAYPELKSSEQFLQLQSRISSLENGLADRRELYNESVTNYNTRIEQFPDSICASFLRYRSAPLFKVEYAERKMPNLKMNIGA